jgi:hypothetical protein
MLHIIGELMKLDPKGKEILASPENWVRDPNLSKFKNSVRKLFQLLVYDIDNFIVDWTQANENFFDYKNFFKNATSTQEMTQKILTGYSKQLVHHPEDAFNRILAST